MSAGERVRCSQCRRVGRLLKRGTDTRELRGCDTHQLMWWTPQRGWPIYMTLAEMTP